MRKFSLILMLWISTETAPAQSYNLDSLRYLLSKTGADTIALGIMDDLALGYEYFHPDSTYYFASREYLLARKLNNKSAELNALISMSIGVRKMGNYPKALENALQSLKISEQINRPDFILTSISEICSIYYYQKDGKNCIAYAFRALSRYKGTKDFISQANLYRQIAGGYEMMNMFDSSLFYQLMAYRQILKSHDDQEIVFCYENLADIYYELHQDSIALINYRLAFPYFVSHGINEGICESALFLARIFETKNKPDSAIWYGQLSLNVAKLSMLTSRQSEASDFLSAFYKKSHQPDSALKYLELSVVLKDSLFNKEKVQEIENLTFDENIRQQEIAAREKLAEENHVRNLQLLAIGIFIPIFFLGVLFLSRTKVKPRVVEFMGILSLLLFFEFITDLIYPYVSQLTNENPIWEMLFLVGIAAMLEPLNFKLEHWVKGHLVRKAVPAIIPLTVESTSSYFE